MKGEEHILVNFPIDTSLKKKAHSAMYNVHCTMYIVHVLPLFSLLTNHSDLMKIISNDSVGSALRL